MVEATTGISEGMKGVHGVRVQVFMDKSRELGFFLCVLQYPFYIFKCPAVMATKF